MCVPVFQRNLLPAASISMQQVPCQHWYTYSTEMQCHNPGNCSLMTDVITGIAYGSSGKDTNLLSGNSQNNYNTIHECDEMAYSSEKSWINHKREVFTYQVFIYVFEVQEKYMWYSSVMGLTECLLTLYYI